MNNQDWIYLVICIIIGCISYFDGYRNGKNDR